MKLKYSLILLLLTTQIFAQWETIRQFPITNDETLPGYSFLLNTANNSLIHFWLEDNLGNDIYFYSDLYYSISSNNGGNWSEKQLLADSVWASESRLVLNGIVTSTGRVLVAYNKDRLAYLSYSDNEGITWSEPFRFSHNIFAGEKNPSFFIDDSLIWIVYEKDSKIYYRTSSDNGSTWSNFNILYATFAGDINPNLFKSDNSLLLIYTDNRSGVLNIEGTISTDGGINWSDNRVILDSDVRIDYLTGVQKSNGAIFLFYQKLNTTPFDNYYQSDIYYVYSTDEGLTWSNENQFTNYVGNDTFPEISIDDNDEIYITFASDRDDNAKKELWYGKAQVSIDNTCPPFIYDVNHKKGEDSLSLIINSLVDDDVQLDSVILDYTVNGTLDFATAMFDDGLHNDQEANDKIYGVKLSNFNYFDELKYTVTAFDDQLNKFSRSTTAVLFNLIQPSFVDVIDVNNIWLPFDHEGTLADADPGSGAGGKYDDIRFFYSGGFYISGYSNSELWTAASHSSTRIQDFQAGTVGADPNFEKYKIYTVRSSDIPFGESWQDWQMAVSIGAKFYDGNKDGIYSPVDLNFNGIWDYNEDRPDFQGDITAWCVYNDGIPKEWRRYWSDQQGIEIKQSLFASAGEGTHYEDIIFIKYEIENTGLIADVFDSVYFAAAIDPDLGEHHDDLIGCDTVDNNTYTYNSGPDQDYGINPPAFFVKQLQGPPVFIPGETFIDNNNDDEFTLGIDTPLDSAVFRRGKYLGNEFIEGAKNLSFSSLMQIMSSHPTIAHPNNEFEARNYLVGGSLKSGEPLDPCTWEFGNGASLLNCHFINPKFMYSGDPVSNDGWINTTPIDQTYFMSTGPFKLKAGGPVELIYAYIVGRGTDHLNSITKAREISQFAQTVYDNNFEDLPTGIDDNENLIADEFQLYQNYPNPFNPTTTIKYQIPSNVKGQLANVKIIVFDILGREIRTLVNEIKQPGTYEVKFDARLPVGQASKLSSGVYFYQLKFADFIQTNKMMLLK